MRRTRSDEFSEVSMGKDTPGPLVQCQKCRKHFVLTRKWQRFCSMRCRMAYWAELRKEVAAEIMKRKNAVKDDLGNT